MTTLRLTQMLQDNNRLDYSRTSQILVNWANIVSAATYRPVSGERYTVLVRVGGGVEHVAESIDEIETLLYQHEPRSVAESYWRHLDLKQREHEEDSDGTP